MSFIDVLASERDAAWYGAKAMLNRAESEGRDLTNSEDAEYRKATARIDEIDARLAEVREVDQRAKNSSETFGRLLARPVDQPGYTGADPNGGKRSWLPGLAEYRELQVAQRAVGTAGAFIPVEYSSTYFDLLRKRTAVLAAGPTTIQVNHAGSISVPKVTSAVTVGSIAENTAFTPADPGLGNLTLDPKKVGALTLVAREAVEDSNPDLRNIVANSLIKDTAVELDRQMIVGDGSTNNMRGLLNISGVTPGPSTGTNGGSLSLAAGFGFLADTLAAYDAANADPDRAAWIMHSRTWSSVRKLVDGQSRPIVSIDPTQNVRPTLWGKPVFISNSIPVTQTAGSSTDCSSIILADMSQVVVAVARDIELMVSLDYAFAADQVAIRVTARYDIGLPQPTGVVVTTGVRP